VKEYPDFDATLDEFFSKLETQRQEIRLIKDKQAAWKKIETVREHFTSQQTSMEQAQQLSIRKARIIEFNKTQVDAALTAVNTEIAKGTDWRDLDRLIKDQKKLGNPVAKLITKLTLDQNKITVTLEDKLAPGEDTDEDDSQGDSDGEGDEEKKKPGKVKPPVKVDLDLTLTAQKNAQIYYDLRKKTAVKHQKTIEASEKALKAAERKTARALKDVDQKVKISRIRKVHWFEKYNWFISSENYLVIAGRDSQQNEAIVRKQLRKNDG
jgi:predicted ribosome quality control (RQC) complex YloA/Tae2 family protein